MQREEYDTTGKVIKTAEEEFVDSFGGGTYRDRVRAAELEPKVNLSEQLAVRQTPAAQSHTSGFEAWLRSRGDTGVKMFTSDDVVEQFGVVKGSYEPVPLPQIKAYSVRGPPTPVFSPLPGVYTFPKSPLSRIPASLDRVDDDFDIGSTA